ncbi:hypothetical protein ACXR0O_02770 [Verrucomicrobiota bacterium sgz303538]
MYERFGGPRDADAIRQSLLDPELPITLKYTAIFAAFAHLTFPLRLSNFRTLVTDAFWSNHFSFHFTKFSSGSYSIDWKTDEWFFTAVIGPVASSPYRSHYSIQMVTSRSYMPPGVPHGSFDPPEDLPVLRYTLIHPFLKPELHEPDGIYLL